MLSSLNPIPFFIIAFYKDPAVKETAENTNDSPKQPSPDNSVENAIQKALNNQLVLPPVPPSQLVLPPVPPSSNLTNEVFKSFPALPGQTNERSNNYFPIITLHYIAIIYTLNDVKLYTVFYIDLLMPP